MASHLEQKIDRCMEDLAKLEEHVTHLAATLVAIVEGAKIAQEAADEDAEDRYPEDGGW